MGHGQSRTFRHRNDSRVSFPKSTINSVDVAWHQQQRGTHPRVCSTPNLANETSACRAATL